MDDRQVDISQKYKKKEDRKELTKPNRTLDTIYITQKQIISQAKMKKISEPYIEDK